jgi:Phage capsid family
LAETAGVLLEEMSLVAHPADVLRLSVAKTDNTDSNVALLAPDASSPTRRSTLGVPLFASPAVAEGVAWLVPKTRAFLVVRSDVDVQFDSSAFFSSDRTAVRAVLRTSPAFPHPEAIVKVHIDGGS